MKKKNGFTLIELLAVIVILAIIALIATPIILNIVEKARKSAFQDSAYGLIESAKLQYVEGILDGTNSAAEYDFGGATGANLKFSGNVPDGGKVIVDAEGNVGLAIYSNGMCALKGIKESTVNVIDYDATTCIVPDAAKDPMIELIGDREITLYIGDTYTELGATAKTVDGTTLTYATTITKDGNVTTSIDTSTVGEYEITYTTEMSNNKTASVTRAIIIQKAICRRAKPGTLHTEECTQTSTINYCSGAGNVTGSIMKYGNDTITEGKLTSGDAYDCDVNGDGVFDSENERFYYVSDLYDTTTKKFNNNYAVLVYYSNTKAGNPDNTAASLITYHSSDNGHGPVTAITNLPTTTQWTNVKLTSTLRAILTERGTTITYNETTTFNLPTAFNYSNYAARLLTTKEVESACAITAGSSITGELETCNYLMENTKYSTASFGAMGYWLETPFASVSNNGAWTVTGLNSYVGGSTAVMSNSYGTRPAIEVLKTDMEM